MKKIIFTLLFLSSCVNKGVNNICGSFSINVEDNTTKNYLFFTKFSENLRDRLELIANDDSNYICKVDVKFNVDTYSTIIDESGYTGRKNFKINVDYVLSMPNNKKITDNVTFFYGSNISDNYYSEYVNSQKRKNNDIDRLSEKVFFSIINKMND